MRRSPIGLIACRTDADRRQTAMDANYRHAYGEVLNAVQELDAALQKSLYATTPAMACTVCTDIYSNAQTAQMALGVLPVQLARARAYRAQHRPRRGLCAHALAQCGGGQSVHRRGTWSTCAPFLTTTTQLSVAARARSAQSLADGAVTTAAHVRSTQSLAESRGWRRICPTRSRRSSRRWPIRLRSCRCRSRTAAYQ
ncbi:MAG: hypothetical protein ACLUNO_11430 [Oscillospiraceae bacterium]